MRLKIDAGSSLNGLTKTMRKVLFAFIVLSFAAFRGMAQPPSHTDSLLQQLKTATEDTNKVNLLITLSLDNVYNNPAKGLDYSLSALTLSQKLNFSIGEVRSLLAMGEALSISGNFTRAIEIKLKGLKLAEKTGNPVLIGDAYINLASFYYYQGDYVQSIIYTKKSFPYPSNYHQKEKLQNGFLGEAFFKLNQLDSALYYTQIAYQLDITTKGRHWSVPYYILGGIHSKQNHPELALNYYRLGLSLMPAKKDVIDGYLGIANVFAQGNNKDSALYYAKKTIVEGRQFSFLPEVLEATALAKNIYKKENGNDSAFFYQELMIEVQDSLFSQEKQKQIQNLTFDEKIRQQELELEKNKQAEERKQNIQYVVIALGLVSLVILFFLFSHSIVAHERLIKFLGILSLLILFEFINLLLHPWLAGITHHSAFLMLLFMVCIAALLIPLHHRLEKWITHRMVEKNKKIKLAAAKKTITKLEGEKN